MHGAITVALGARDETTVAGALDLRHGDTATMRSAFAEHGPLIARTVQALACTTDHTEDLVQEVFVIAFTTIDRYDSELPMASWLRGIAVNVVRAFRRREARRGRLRERFGPVAGERPATPEEALSTRRLADRLWVAVDALPGAEREAFVLRVIEQQSLSECSVALGRSIKSVSRQAVAAERKVREAVESAQRRDEDGTR